MKRQSSIIPKVCGGMIILSLMLSGCAHIPQTVKIFADTEIPQIQFAIDEMMHSFPEGSSVLPISESINADIVISISSEVEGLGTEGFQLDIMDGNIHITGHDAAGAMDGVFAHRRFSPTPIPWAK